MLNMLLQCWLKYGWGPTVSVILSLSLSCCPLLCLIEAGEKNVLKIHQKRELPRNLIAVTTTGSGSDQTIPILKRQEDLMQLGFGRGCNWHRSLIFSHWVRGWTEIRWWTQVPRGTRWKGPDSAAALLLWWSRTFCVNTPCNPAAEQRSEQFFSNTWRFLSSFELLLNLEWVFANWTASCLKI